MGASKTTLVDIYYKQIRSVLEFASVVWTAGLTQDDIYKIKRGKKMCCAIQGSDYRKYEEAFDKLEKKTLIYIYICAVFQEIGCKCQFPYDYVTEVVTHNCPVVPATILLI